MDAEKYVQSALLGMRDEAYRDFQSGLMPTVDPQTIIGVRMPLLRRFAKDFAKGGAAEEFMAALPHKYYEENNLHGLLIEKIGDYDRTIEALDRFLPFVDNWATCDMMSPKVFAKNTGRLIEKIHSWLTSGSTYTVRFAIGMLMRFYLDDGFKIEYAELTAGVKDGDYYVDMMRAWYFATALAKQYDSVIPFLENKVLDRRTHNKAIQKAIESRRISGEQKVYLRSLRR